MRIRLKDLLGTIAYSAEKGAVARCCGFCIRSRGLSLIILALLHPGFVRTDMTGHRGLIDADESVRGLLARMDELTLENSGSFRHQNGETLPW